MTSLFDTLRNISLPFFTGFKVYFDLGTTTTRIAIKDKGIVLKEPSFLAYNTEVKDYIFFGTEAKNIMGKTPEFLKIIRPIISGIVSDFDAEVALIKKFIERSVSPYLQSRIFIQPPLEALAVFPVITTEIEQKAVEEAILKAQCNSVTLIKKPLASAAGCDINIFSHKPNLILDMGGGLIEISIISGGGIVTNKTLKNAGEHMDKLIANYVYLKHGVVLGEATCERLKLECFNFTGEEKIQLVRGKSLENGLPKSVKIKTSDVREALYNNFIQITDAIKELIELSPPEVVDEVFDTGIFLTGKLAAIEGLDTFLNQEVKIEVNKTPHFSDAAIYGLAVLDKEKGVVQKIASYTRN
ncbi:MAG: rod shape-determining protein [Patescibacteria group bacterium]